MFLSTGNAPEGGDGAADDVQLVPEEGGRVHHLEVLVGVAVIQAKALQGANTEGNDAGNTERDTTR